MTDLPETRFDAADADRAAEEWGCNCGPAAVAAVCGLTLDEVRPHLHEFERKRYTNPLLMYRILDSVGAKWTKTTNRGILPLYWPGFGLARIQWHGPWTAPGVPHQAAYRHTHWVGSMRGITDIGIFDVNALANGTGWVSVGGWSSVLVPMILEACEPKADGEWSITHAIEVQRT